MFLPIVYFCTTTRSGRFGQAIVDTVKFLLPIATRNLPTNVNINLNASVKKISASGCARHQIDQSIKFPQSFCSVNNNIVCDLSGYALFASLDCIVRDRLSTNASTSSVSGISNASATRSNDSRVGVFLPLNQLDQFAESISVRTFNFLYESSKKYSLFLLLNAYIRRMMFLKIGKFANQGVVYKDNIAQTTKHPRHQVLAANQYPGKDGSRPKLYDKYTRPRGRSPSPHSFTMPFVAEMGGDSVMTKETSIKGKFYPLQYDEWLKACQELTPTAKDVLYLVKTLDPYSNGVEISAAEIARQLSTEKKTVHCSTVSRAFKELGAKGFIDPRINKQDFLEKRIRVRLQDELSGLFEVITPAGRIDLLTDNEIIEIKHVSDWKSAMGQILTYSGFYPEHKKRIHLFGKKRELPSSTAVTICGELGITLTFKEVE